jgi:UDP-N-acetylglucosamine--N-acetylmuramyl-(pentapeptide) pyrophosphoryl-undecaprenol N-acetylglucosamine transferase
LLRKPLLIHEQNAIPGFTNRLLRHLARRVMQAFPASFAGNHKLMHTGNPLRGEILALEEPAQRYARHEGPLRILVVGGSLGAVALNQQVPAALSLLRGECDFEVWHQTGKGKLDATDEIYARAGIAARTEMFIEDMATAYAWADLVICRAGALTVSELAVAGVASILIPYPHAADNHQLANAAQLQQAGAALVLTQDRLSPAALADILRDLFDKGRSPLLDMAQQARKAAMPQATETVARACLEVMHG